jgi:hypothetical protein
MASKDESILNLLAVLPWWVSVLVSGGVYVTLKYILPTIEFDVGRDMSRGFLKGLVDAAPKLALPITAVLLLPGILSLVSSLLKGKHLGKNKSVKSRR